MDANKAKAFIPTSQANKKANQAPSGLQMNSKPFEVSNSNTNTNKQTDNQQNNLK